jgi:hypothetical protein
MPESFTEKPGIISQLAGQSKVGHVRGRENGKKRRRPIQICPWRPPDLFIMMPGALPPYPNEQILQRVDVFGVAC